MRILILTALFLAPIYYFTQKDSVETSDISIDSVKVKMGAPERLPEPKVRRAASILPQATRSPSKASEEKVSFREEGAEHFEELKSDDELETVWNTELKEMLNRLEPADSEQIYKSYISQQESYQSELESLLNEKSQKGMNEPTIEIDQLISQLDQNHQNSLKEIFGAHYEALRDDYADFVESLESED